MSVDARSRALTALTRYLVADAPMDETLRRVAEITVDALPAARMAGITLLGRSGRPTTAVYTDRASPEIDGAQYDSGRGPCLDAWRTGRSIRLDDVAAAEDRYPEFSRLARQHGVYSTLSLPLVAAGTGLGALNLYSPHRHGFDEDAESLGTDLSAVAAVVLANASAYWGAAEQTRQLQEALESRGVIEQAKGILMAREPDLSPQDAFDLLRRASQRENVKLRDIAQRVVDRRSPGGS